VTIFEKDDRPLEEQVLDEHLPDLEELMEEKRMGAMEKALEAIRKEREYQDRLWGNAASRGKHTVPEWILFMQNYLKEAEDVVCRKAAPLCDVDALHAIRKIAAMAVCCMEQNGIVYRDMGDLEHSCELHGVNCEEKEE